MLLSGKIIRYLQKALYQLCNHKCVNETRFYPTGKWREGLQRKIISLFHGNKAGIQFLRQNKERDDVAKKAD